MDTATLAATLAPGNLGEPWPGSLHPDLAERTYTPQRVASRRWVDGLFTRGGLPRWDRIRRCGAPVALWRVDGATSWEHRFCKDRACIACAKSRSRKMSELLRRAMDTRDDGAMYFVTLTRPRRVGETATQAFDAWVKAWAAIRRTSEWSALVGGVRAMEATWSEGHERAKNRRPGWHVHAHCVMELRDDAPGDCPSCTPASRHVLHPRRTRAVSSRRGCTTCGSRTHRGDGTMPRDLANLLIKWAAIVEGSTKAQCAVPLLRDNVGQLAKYISKLWELPSEKARDLFEAVAGRRIIEGFGAWRRWRSWGAVERTPHGWFSSRLSLSEIERMPGDALVSFFARGPADEMSCSRDGDAVEAIASESRKCSLLVEVAAMPASMLLAKIRKDPRPVWERMTDSESHEHAAAVRRLMSIVRETVNEAREPQRIARRVPECMRGPPYARAASHVSTVDDGHV